jgi:tetratricopeptide (TPR) repeat protein/transglutaminase-like putative cysteine protease
MTNIGFRVYCRSLLLLFATALLPISSVAAQQRESTEDLQAVPFVMEELARHQRFENSGLGTESMRVRVHVLTEQGRMEFGQVYFPFREGFQEVSVKYLRAIKPSGEIVEASTEGLFEVTAVTGSYGPVFSDLKYKVLPVPGLQVGDRIEYEVVTETREALKPGDFWDSHLPARSVRVLSEKVTLDVPSDRPVMLTLDEEIPHDVEDRGDRRIYSWTFDNPEPTFGTALEKRLYSVSTMTSWEEVGRWLYDLAAERAEQTPELKSLATKLVEGKDSPRERLDAIYAYVSQSIRYVAISFGVGGFQPHHASEVLKNQYGDCKDKHQLLAALLHSVGLRAYPAFMNTLLRIESAVPSPAEFDHVISMVPLDDEQIWLDTNTAFAPMGFIWPTWRGRKQALVVSKEDSRLVDIPADGPVPELRKVLVRGSVDASGTLNAKLVHEERGSAEVLWRGLEAMGSHEQLEFVLKAMHSFSLLNAELDAVTTSDPRALDEPFTLRCSMSQKRFLSPLKRTNQVTLPSPLLTTMLRSFSGWSDADSEMPSGYDQELIELGGPLTAEETMEIDAPSFTITTPPAFNQNSEFARYESAYSVQDGKLTVRRSLRVTQATLPGAARDELLAFVEAVDRDRDQNVIFLRVGEVDTAQLPDGLSADELNDAGNEALAQQDFELAAELYKEATVVDPEHKWAWNNLGRAYASQRNFDDARAAFEKQIEIDPNDAYAHGNLGRLLMQGGEAEKAVAEIKKHIAISPDDAQAYLLLAAACTMLERFGEAEAAYKTAAEKGLRTTAVLIGLGVAQSKLGKEEKALASFEQALELSGTPDTYNGIAYALAELERDLDRAHNYALSAVLRVEAEFRLLDSLKAWERSFMTQEALAAYLDTLGWVHFKRGNPESSLRCLTASFALEPATEVANHIASILAVQNRRDEAMEFYARGAFFAAHRPAELPDELIGIIEKKFRPHRAGFDSWLDSKQAEVADSLALKPAEGKWTWPSGVKAKDTHRVNLIVLVDERGKVGEVEVIEGDPPWKEIATKDATRIRFDSVSWDDRPIKTVRILAFVYQPGKQILARSLSMGEALRHVGLSAPLRRSR